MSCCGQKRHALSQPSQSEPSQSEPSQSQARPAGPLAPRRGSSSLETAMMAFLMRRGPVR
jgi:hypothetical protein